MKPLIWDIPEDFKELHIMDYNWRPMEERTDSLIFMRGKRLPCEDVGQIKCSLDPKEYDLIFVSEVRPEEFTKFNCLPNNAASMPPLVNKKVLDILNKHCHEDIQAFPATIIPDKNSKYSFENHDYWLINITKLVDAIDLEKSALSFFAEMPNRVSRIKKLSFLDNVSSEIARVSNDHTLKIVSPSLAQAFK